MMLSQKESIIFQRNSQKLKKDEEIVKKSLTLFEKLCRMEWLYDSAVIVCDQG